ncbi:hypothetical protein BX600DRAFT_514379 [Xylariales sp. PMI_506]|nr:hypothetical protein BX600DRAFT_514379 [Xylariales sp. PMI_506]
MKGGNRRGASVARLLRIDVRDDGDSGPDSPESTSSPSPTSSTASTPSPTSTTFTTSTTSTTSATGNTSSHSITSVSFTSTLSTVTTSSVTSTTTTSPLAALTTTVAPTITTSRSKATQPTSSITSQPQLSHDVDRGPAGGQNGSISAGLGAGIGLGIVGGIALAAAGFFLWRKLRRRSRSKREWEARNSSHTHLDGPDDHGSWPIGGAFVPTFGSNDNAPSGQFNENGYLREKAAPVEYSAEEPAAPEAGRSRLSTMVSTWMQRHTSQMIDPMSARASRISGATGVTGWSPIAPGGAALDSSDSIAWPSEGAKSANVSARPELRLPPPPAPTVAPTEVTNRTSGTWNTWGVIQHRENKSEGWTKKIWAR